MYATNVCLQIKECMAHLFTQEERFGILENMEEIDPKRKHSEALRDLGTRVNRFVKKVKLGESVCGGDQ